MQGKKLLSVRVERHANGESAERRWTFQFSEADGEHFLSPALVALLIDYAKGHDSDLEFGLYVTESPTNGHPTPDPAALMYGETTLYGQVVSISTESVPKLCLKTHHGLVRCDVTAEQAKELGQQLNDVIGVTGAAGWNRQTLAVETFRVAHVLPYRPIPADAAFEQLAVATNGAYDNLDDVHAYMNELRGYEDSEA